MKSFMSMMDSASGQILKTVRAEGAATRESLSGMSAQLKNISATAEAISANQQYANQLLEISNERQNSIIRNQEFEQMLITQPSVFGGRTITQQFFLIFSLFL